MVTDSSDREFLKFKPGTFFLFDPAKEKSSKKEDVGHRTLLNSKFPQSYLRKIR